MLVGADPSIELLQRALVLCNKLPRFRFMFNGEPTDSYKLASAIEDALRKRLPPEMRPSPPAEAPDAFFLREGE